MRTHHLIAFAALALAAFAAPAQAVPVMDGTADAEYGAALSVQNTNTQFGNGINGDPINAGGGSEINQVFAKVVGGRLYVHIAGNLETNFNKLEIFIDSKAGGQAVFQSPGNDGAGAMNGLVFDVGFLPDYHIIVRRGNDNGNDKFDIDFADLQAQTASSYGDVLGGQTGSGATGTGVANTLPILVAYDNSNIAGVIGGTAAANQAAAAAVTTGVELGISLADLGYTGGEICVMAGQNNQGHNYWSNQFLGGLPAPQGNLGSDGTGAGTGSGAINMQAAYAGGDQFFCFNPIPEPSTLALAGLAVCGLAARRRK